MELHRSSSIRVPMKYIYAVHAINRRNWCGTIALCVAFAVPPATLRGQTYTVNGGMPVRMEIIASCTFSTSDLDFGTYAASGDTPALGQSSIQLLCPQGVAVEISLDAGTSSAGGTRRRQMSSDFSRDNLDYDLFQDAGRNIHWGDESGRDTLELLATGEPQTIPVYGEILARQRADPGTYNDIVTVFVQF
jgi:spore coat protein U-like protein